MIDKKKQKTVLKFDAGGDVFGYMIGVLVVSAFLLLVLGGIFLWRNF